ncbi:MAG: hypothetical protein ACXVNF_04015 [Neobacillus sp.]
MECSLQDMSQAGGINLSGPTLWKGKLELNKQSIKVNSRFKTAELVDFSATSKSQDEVVLSIYSFGLGDLLIAHKETIAMGKDAVSLIDAKSKLGLTCAIESKN